MSLNREEFTEFMSDMLEILEERLHAPKGSLIFLKNDKLEGGEHTYSYRAVPMHKACYIGFRTDWPAECEGYRFLLSLAAEEVCNCASDSEIFRQNGGKGDHWAFNRASRKWNTRETLADQIYEMICFRVFPWIHRCLGFEPLSLSRIDDMVYEADAAEGMIVFQTGDLADSYKIYRINADKAGIPFSTKAERFVRKQLAGAGKNRLLFVRKSTDDQEQYVYSGYLVPLSDDTGGERFFVSVLLKRGGNWILQINERPVLHVKHREVFLPTDDLSQVKENIDNEFGPGMSEKLSVVLDALHAQKHGTSVIFLDMEDRASQEMMTRLEKNGRALKIEGIHIDEEGCPDFKESLESISRIDGALICDIHTMCILYVNVIVDGIALTPGRKDCGARHNALESAIVNLVYQNTSKPVKALAAIFSEDGGISSVSASQCYEKLEPQKRALRRRKRKEKTWKVYKCGLKPTGSRT